MGEATGRRVVGVVGGGPLCLMLGEEIRRKGLPYDLVAVDPGGDCPARPILKNQIVAGVTDPAAISRLAAESDFITFDIGQVDCATLEALEKSGKNVHPSPATLRAIQDRLVQRTCLRSKGLPVPDFRPVAGLDDLVSSLRDFGFPALLKARTLSCDGRGSQMIATPAEAEAAFGAFNGRELLLERSADVEMEISVIAARSSSGEIRTYPVGENIRGEGLLQTTIVPARIDAATARAAGELAHGTLKALQGVGVFGIEMVVDKKGAIFIHEIAPRVHNSGHYTIEACRTSQFEQHVRAITGMPLGETTLIYSAVTVYLVGAPDLRGPYVFEGVDSVRAIPGAHVHLYGKKQTVPGRMLGHVTLVDVDDPGYRDGLIHRADHVRRMIVQKEKKR